MESLPELLCGWETLGSSLGISEYPKRSKSLAPSIHYGIERLESHEILEKKHHFPMVFPLRRTMGRDRECNENCCWNHGKRMEKDGTLQNAGLSWFVMVGVFFSVKTTD